MIKLFNREFVVTNFAKLFKIGKFTLWQAEISYHRFDGALAGFKWIIFERSDSMAVLVYRASDKKICLVEQFRPATLVFEGQIDKLGGELLEIPAGMIEPGESLKEAVHRETQEEIGRLVKNLRFVTKAFLSPGTSSEEISILLADDDGEAGMAGGGVLAEGEDIRVHWVSLSEATRMIEEGLIKDAKTILAIQAFLLEQK